METLLAVLEACRVENDVLKLPAVQMDRNLYLSVKDALQVFGGRWKGGRIKGFVFDGITADAALRDAIAAAVEGIGESGFFETPPSVADRLVELAGIQHGDHVLEPSAGRGAIIDAIRRAHPGKIVHYYELMEANVTRLEQRCDDRLVFCGYDFIVAAGLDVDVGLLDQGFNRIIATPPFAKNVDVEHVRVMYRALAPGGRIVSIMSPHWTFANDRKSRAFRKWFREDIDSDITQLPDGTFKPSGTDVPSVLVVINKEGL